MKSKFRILLATITFIAGLALLFAALALPGRLAAQDKQEPQPTHARSLRHHSPGHAGRDVQPSHWP